MAFYTCPDCLAYVATDDPPHMHAKTCSRRLEDERQENRNLAARAARAVRVMGATRGK